MVAIGVLSPAYLIAGHVIRLVGQPNACAIRRNMVGFNLKEKVLACNDWHGRPLHTHPGGFVTAQVVVRKIDVLQSGVASDCFSQGLAPFNTQIIGAGVDLCTLL